MAGMWVEPRASMAAAQHPYPSIQPRFGLRKLYARDVNADWREGGRPPVLVPATTHMMCVPAHISATGLISRPLASSPGERPSQTGATCWNGKS